MIQRY